LTLFRDLNFAARSLRKSPLFTAVAVLSVALGIGANAAVFTLLDQVVLRVLPVKDPAALVQLHAAPGSESFGGGMGDGSELSYPLCKDFATRTDVFTGVFCRATAALNVGTTGRSQRAAGELVSGTFFETLGLSAALGRTLVPDDDRVVSGSPVAVLSYDYWKSAFGGRADALGRKVVIDGHPFTVVGVLQEGFRGIDLGAPVDVYLPITMQPQIGPSWLKIETRRFRWAQVYGRLKPGMTLESAQAALQPFLRSVLTTESADASFVTAAPDAKQRFINTRLAVDSAEQGRSGLRNQVTNPLKILMAVAAGVLLIACLNVANLLVARGAARHREIALRLALGAGRRRIIGLLLLESLIVAAAGAVLGLLIASWGSSLLLAFYTTPDSPLAIDPSPDARVIAFTTAVAALTAIVAGLVPAVRSTRLDLAPTLKGAGGAVLGEQARLRKTLVVAQVALSFLLLVGAGLFVHSLSNLLKSDPGVRVERLLVFSLDLETSGYSPPRDRQLADRLLETLEQDSQVRSASYAFFGLMEGGGWGMGFTLEGEQPKPGKSFDALCNAVTPDYFSTLGVPIVAGRAFTTRDNNAPPQGTPGWPYREAIVNEEFVKQYYGGRNPIGRHVGIGDDPGTATPIEIVGVSRNAKYMALREDPRPQIFFPYAESGSIQSATFFIRTAGDASQAINMARRQVAQMDPNLPVFNVHTLEEQVQRSVASERLIASLSGVFSGLATGLAMVGLYGVMSYTVTRRTREIGIRMALGAMARDVARRVMGEAGLLVAIGLLSGGAAAWWLTRYISSQLYEVTPLDGVTYAGAAALLTIVAMLATFLPARRAARIEPMRALRDE
jgi:predicted permease